MRRQVGHQCNVSQSANRGNGTPVTTRARRPASDRAWGLQFGAFAVFRTVSRAGRHTARHSLGDACSPPGGRCAIWAGCAAPGEHQRARVGRRVCVRACVFQCHRNQQDVVHIAAAGTATLFCHHPCAPCYTTAHREYSPPVAQEMQYSESRLREALFLALRPVHDLFCSFGVAICVAGCLISGAFWYIGTLVSIFFVGIFAARALVDGLPSQRAIVLFGRSWLGCTVWGCSSFVAGNMGWGLCTGVDSDAVYLLACLTSLVPVYLHLSGVSQAHRIMNSMCIATAFHASPQWSQMPHEASSILMGVALMVGELIGLILVERARPMLLAVDANEVQPVADDGLRIDPVSSRFDLYTVEEDYVDWAFAQTAGKMHMYASCASAAMLSIHVAASDGLIHCAWLSLPVHVASASIWCTHDVARNARQARSTFNKVWLASLLLSVCGAVLVLHRSSADNVLVCEADELRNVRRWWLSRWTSTDRAGTCAMAVAHAIASMRHRATVVPPTLLWAYRIGMTVMAVLSHVDGAKDTLCPNVLKEVIIMHCINAFGEMAGTLAPLPHTHTPDVV